MLGLATHEPYFRVLREDVFFQESKIKTCPICGQQGHKAEECRGRAKQKNGEFDEKGKGSSLKPFIWLHVSVLREYLSAELYVEQQPFAFDLERALDDWVFMCFFVGNDFLPHLPSLDIRENGIDTLIAIWRDSIPLMDGYVTRDGHVDAKKAQLIMLGLAKQEDSIFRRRRQVEEKKAAAGERRKQEQAARKEEQSSKKRKSSPANRRSREEPDLNHITLITPGRGELSRRARELTQDLVTNRGAVYKANMANKSAAEVLKSKLLKGAEPAQNGDGTGNDGTKAEKRPFLGKRKANAIEDETSEGDTSNQETAAPAHASKEDELPPDTVRLWEPGYADRYYEQKFGVDPANLEFRREVARAYTEGLCWVLLYYFQGCPSWTWYYPYHYAPFAADFVGMGDMDIHFEKGIPFKPFEQLMGVLPASSNHAIPEVFHELMSDPKSEIIDFYPEDFPVDLNGKKFAWQGVVLLPFIDEQRLLAAMHKKYHLLTEDEKIRNQVGHEVLFLSDRHPLYGDLVANFYSKRKGQPKYKLNMRVSEGLAGKVERNEVYIPHSYLNSSLEEYGMPSLDEDHSLLYVPSCSFEVLSVHANRNRVNYEIPKSSHIHKSMLLRGVKPPPPTLNSSDIQAVKSKALQTGRPFSGAPLRNNNSRHNGYNNNNAGRGAHTTDRPNPFAAFLDPKFMPPNAGVPMMRPVGWNPAVPGSAGFSQGPPPPVPGGMVGFPFTAGQTMGFVPRSYYGQAPEMPQAPYGYPNQYFPLQPGHPIQGQQGGGRGGGTNYGAGYYQHSPGGNGGYY